MQRKGLVGSCLPLLALAAQLVVPARAAADAGDVADAAAAYREATEAYRRLRSAWRRAQSLSALPAQLDRIGLQISEEVWRLRQDPLAQAWWRSMRALYRPRLEAGAVAGAQGDSSPYGALVVGASADVAAPLCRYVGGHLDSHAFADPVASGVAYDGRATACLPLGPFSIELGLLRQRGVRVALATSPSLPRARFDSDGFEMRIRLFRWLERDWEAAFAPTDVVFRSYRYGGGLEPNNAFQVDTAFVRYARFGAGLAGEDRVVEAISATVTGNETDDPMGLSTTVMDVAPVRLRQIPLGAVYLDASVSLIQARITELPAADESLYNRFFAGADVALAMGDVDWEGRLRYHRYLLPDSDYRLLGEDRLAAELSEIDPSSALTGQLFAAHLRERARPPGVDAFGSHLLCGVVGLYERQLFGPVQLSLRSEVARSFYADPEVRLVEPEWEIRVGSSLLATWGTP